MGITNLVTIGGVNITNLKTYNLNDVGRKTERKQFAGSDVVYMWDKGYYPAFRDLEIRGEALVADADSLAALYQNQTTVSVTDLYGKTYSVAQIISFEAGYLKAVGAREVSLHVVIFNNVNDRFSINGNVEYGIESCIVTDKGSRGNTVETIDGSVYLNSRQYVNTLFEIQLSGVMVSSSSFAGAASGISAIVLPDSSVYRAIQTSRNISLIEGTSGFKKFTLTYLATNDSGALLIGDAGLGALYESLSIHDKSGRISVHNVIGGRVIQKFENVSDFDYSLSYLIGRYSTDPYTIGSEITVTINGRTINGMVLNKNYSAVLEMPMAMRVNVALASMPD